jgi:hypothetical protein
MMMVAVTIFALLSAAFSILGLPFLALLVGLWFMSAVVILGTMAIYCHGYRRTACAAACFGWLCTTYFFPAVRIAWSAQYLLIMVIVPVLSAGVCAGVALVTRRFVERRGWHLPQ